MAPERAVLSKNPLSTGKAVPTFAGLAVTVVLTFFLLAALLPSTVLAADPPTVTALSVTSGPTIGGTTVLITGTGFTGLSVVSPVSFGDVAAAKYTVVSATQISAVTPAHGQGAVNVVITAEGGTNADTAADDFTFMTRYDQNDSRLVYSVAFSPFSKASAWKGSYARSNAGGASVTITFTGTRLDWVGMMGTTTGMADVSLDGVFQKTVDLASPVAVYQQKVWSTGLLNDGPHTVKIARNPTSAAGRYLTIDAVDVLGAITGPGRVEQTDKRIAYGGTWYTFSVGGASGGSYLRAKTGGSTAVVDFDGTYLAWVATKGTTLGKAWVALDGGTPVNIDLAAPVVAYRQRVWDTGTLAAGDHRVRIWWDNTNPAGKFISIDAFDVEGDLTQAYFTTRYEEDEPRFLYTGTWSTMSSGPASGGAYKMGSGGAGVTLNFTGTRLDWVATLGPNMAAALVSVDGKAATSVDLYNPEAVAQRVVYSTGVLVNGKHVVEISWDEANAPGTYIAVDAFDVAGTVPWELTLRPEQARWIEQRLTDLSYRPGAVDGVFDAKTRGALIAFQKWEGLTRNGQVSATVLTRLAAAARPRPSKNGAGDVWLEVNKAKQVLLYCKDGSVVRTLPVSTGSASVGIVTPSRTYRVTRKTLETSPRYLPLYMTNTLLAIHGYPNVPTYPASHGCVRTQTWDQNELYPLIPVGTYVYIY